MGIRKIPEWQKDKHLFGLWRHSEAEEKKSKLDEVFRNIAGIAKSSGSNAEAAKLKKKQEEQREELKKNEEEKKKQKKREYNKRHYLKYQNKITAKKRERTRNELEELPEGKGKEERKRRRVRVEKARSAEIIACESIGARHNPASRPFDGTLGSSAVEVKNYTDRLIFKHEIKEFREKLDRHNVKLGFFFGWAFGQGVKEYAMSENIICINLELAYKKAGVDTELSEEVVRETFRSRRRDFGRRWREKNKNIK